MKAVATMTPEPKYFATKNAHDGTSVDWLRFANVGKIAPVCCQYMPMTFEYFHWLWRAETAYQR